jgi:hypothetical protein
MAECRPAPEGLAAAVAATLQAVTRLRGDVRLVDAGTLPNDGRSSPTSAAFPDPVGWVERKRNPS